MTPRLLFIGVGRGSFEVRGVQLGRAMGARVTTKPSADDWAWADVIVLIKHAIETYGDHAKATGKTVVWDALDFWKQPEDNGRSVAEMTRLVAERKKRFGIAHVIGATKSMAHAVGGSYLPHHHRPGLVPGDVRPELKTVAYEGKRKYLGSWGKALQRTCDRLGLRFVVNPTDIREADLLVAFRGEEHDGDLCRQWKSGVKFANAIAAGRPILSQPCAAFDEIQPYGDMVSSRADLEAAIAWWQPIERRATVCHDCPDDAFALADAARAYASILQTAWRVAA